MKIFAITLATIFLAELGDKTQIATMLFASDTNTNKYLVLLGTSMALVTTSVLGVLIGSTLSNYIDEKILKLIGGIGFLVVGVWTIISR